MTPRFDVYIRNGCHLCEDMMDHLRLLQQEYDFELRETDIDDDPQLVAAYGTRIPVLSLEGEEICQYTLDIPRFKSILGHHVR
jgi:hypothetical protein